MPTHAVPGLLLFTAGLRGAARLLPEERCWLRRGVLFRPLLRLLRHRSAHYEDLAPLHPLVNEALRLSAALERRLPLHVYPGTTLFARARTPG